MTYVGELQPSHCSSANDRIEATPPLTEHGAAWLCLTLEIDRVGLTQKNGDGAKFGAC